MSTVPLHFALQTAMPSEHAFVSIGQNSRPSKYCDTDGLHGAQATWVVPHVLSHMLKIRKCRINFLIAAINVIKKIIAQKL